MTVRELLNKYYDEEMNAVFCYSANYLMNAPKKGYENEWREANKRAEQLDTLIKSFDKE